MLFADIRNITSLEYRVAVRPLTTEEKIRVKEWAKERHEFFTRTVFPGHYPEKEKEHVRRIVEEKNYLEQIEILEHVGMTWELPQS